ncbi:hypothetical protein BDM02DRAFT_3185272 [Thelephora ganbajun]|uniref:Uncharacterized protein n=1 Tax=Thelephora ganbajun TaxID=370292 RepID=A0ACB6ZMH8_THEGA|nr:hypothetical protein BDM02DRAFT_3185272 [Thelephora ganbajun]
MFQFSPTSSAHSPRHRPPPRDDSLYQNGELAGLRDELRDFKRVHDQGQEEDLRMALSRTITKVEELSTSLIEHYKTHTELQTELTLCKSNLTMAQANNEMLEDALRRDSVRAKNVGWGRQSATTSILDDDARSTRSLDAERPVTPNQPASVSPTVHPPQGQEGRFFKFRFGSTTPSSSSGFATPNGVHPSHLSSASLPSLSSSKDEEIEKLTLELEKRKKECCTALDEKKKVEDELESLSQALFEEANKMVAHERMKVADLEDELRERASEREALKLAMKILEEENQRFRNILTSASQVVRHVKATTPTRCLTPNPNPNPNPSRSHSRHSSQSSLSMPIVSSAPGSPHTSPQYLTSSESSPWTGNVTHPGKTPTTADFAKDKGILRPRPVTRSLPPSLEVDGWVDSPDTPYYTSAPLETVEPDEGAPITVRVAARNNVHWAVPRSTAFGRIPRSLVARNMNTKVNGKSKSRF